MKVMIDGAPVHNKSISHMIDVMKAFVLDHPPFSPDLNPIENVWAMMSCLIWTYEKPTNRAELRTAIWKVWNGLTPAQLDPFFRNMPDRMQAVIDLGGKRTKY